MKAILNGTTLAESDDTLMIEGSYYFPPNSVNYAFLEQEKRRTVCYWKGIARYYQISTANRTLPHGAWTYPKPTRLSRWIIERDFSHFVSFTSSVKLIT